jgi:hypothetical protein
MTHRAGRGPQVLAASIYGFLNDFIGLNGCIV